MVHDTSLGIDKENNISNVKHHSPGNTTKTNHFQHNQSPTPWIRPGTIFDWNYWVGGGYMQRSTSSKMPWIFMKICGGLSYVKPLNMTAASGKVEFSPSNSLNWGSMRCRRPETRCGCWDPRAEYWWWLGLLLWLMSHHQGIKCYHLALGSSRKVFAQVFAQVAFAFLRRFPPGWQAWLRTTRQKPKIHITTAWNGWEWRDSRSESGTSET